MSKTIHISIDPLGRPKLEGNNFFGTECLTKMKPYEDALSKSGDGLTIVEKPEMHMVSEDATDEQYLTQ